MDPRIGNLIARGTSQVQGVNGQSFASSSGGATAGSLGPMVGGTVASITTRAGGGVADVATGRISLAILEGIAVGLIVFYVWTHGLQDGL